MAKRGRRHVDIDVRDAIYAELLSGEAPPRVAQKLDLDERYAGRVPTVRTIQYMAKEVRRLPGDPWSLMDRYVASEDLPVVLEAQRATIVSGRPEVLTRAEAETLVRVARAAPDLPAIAALAFARAYLNREENEEPTNDIDAVLAMAPWRRPEHEESYRQAVRNGIVPEFHLAGAALILVRRR